MNDLLGQSNRAATEAEAVSNRQATPYDDTCDGRPSLGRNPVSSGLWKPSFKEFIYSLHRKSESSDGA